MRPKQTADTKNHYWFHPTTLRIACIEILALLFCMVILVMTSISAYQLSVFASISKTNEILASDLQTHYERETADAAMSTEDWLLSGYAQQAFDWATEETHANYFLFNADGECLFCSEQTASAPENITLQAETLKIIQEEGTFVSDSIAILHPEKQQPVLSKGITLMLMEPDGQITTYYLFSNTVTDVLNAFIIRMWAVGIICFAVLSIAAVAITAIYIHLHQRPLEEMMQAAKRFAKGDYENRLDPASYQDPTYEAMAYSINELAYSAENAETSRKQFVSNVSHELRTPMTIISGYVEAILDGTVPRSKQTQSLSIVSQEMQRLKILISSMLNLTKFDNGTIQIHYRLFTIQDLVFRTVLMFEQRMEKKEITLEGLDTEPLQIWGDADLLGQVIYNLFENAVKFVNTGGTISFSFTEEADVSVIAIRNTGKGISKEELPKIFERFYKSDDSRSHDKTGLGIGLDITKHIIHLHKAQISVSSEEDVYTEFVIRLPKKKDTPSESADIPKANS